MMVGSHFYIGLSERTNVNGAQQVIRFLENYGLSGSMVELEETLHLKTGAAYLEQNNLIVCGEFLLKEEFNIDHITLQLEYNRCDNKEIIHQEGN